ncbi:DegV family protein [Lagierella sp.]|uniref:DegV family protein n=1 Tax=Lagierella sp. TaxID=2849657 RepID=UPI0026323F3B|nr:DegV family protein [Lagierella sp.]
MNIKLIIDSGSDMSQELAKKYGITVIPLTAISKEDEYKDGIEILPDELYQRIREGELFTTSQVSVEQYVNEFKKEIDNDNKILCLTLSSGISGCYNSAKLAKDLIIEEYPKAEIEIIDTKMASYEITMLAIRVITMINQNLSLEEIVLKTKEFIKATYVIFTVDDMKYLHRGGRVSTAQKVIGGMLNIKPILTMDDDGKLKPIDKARGLKKVYKKFAQYIQENMDSNLPKDQLVIIGHADSLDLANELKSAVEEELNFTNIYIDEIGAVIGSHTGPGCLMITMLKEVTDDSLVNIKIN